MEPKETKHGPHIVPPMKAYQTSLSTSQFTETEVKCPRPWSCNMTNWGFEPRSSGSGALTCLGFRIIPAEWRHTGSLGPLLGLVRGRVQILCSIPNVHPPPAPTPKPGVFCLYPLLGSGSNTYKVKERQGRDRETYRELALVAHPSLLRDLLTGPTLLHHHRLVQGKNEPSPLSSPQPCARILAQVPGTV